MLLYLSVCSPDCPRSQLRNAANPWALREVLDRWVPENLEDVVSCLPGAEAGGQRAVGGLAWSSCHCLEEGAGCLGFHLSEKGQLLRHLPAARLI